MLNLKNILKGIPALFPARIKTIQKDYQNYRDKC